MRGRWWLSLVLLLLGCQESAVIAPGGCRIDDDCAVGEVCVAQTCQRMIFVLDSGFVPEDAAASDSSDWDSGADTGIPDSGVTDAAADVGCRVLRRLAGPHHARLFDLARCISGCELPDKPRRDLQQAPGNPHR